MKWNKNHIILSLFVPVQILILQILSNYPEFVEDYYSNGIYPYVSSFLRIIFGWIPFSIGDVLLLVLLIYFILFIIRLIKDRFSNIFPKIIKLISVFSIIYFCFYLFWGINYYRLPLSKSLGFKEKKYSTEQLANVTNHIIKELNFYQNKITKNDTLLVKNTYSRKEMYEIAVLGYDSLHKSYKQFSYKYKSVKGSMMSLLQTYNGTSGYINPLTGEANINIKIPKNSYPTTICHEMAHQIGFAAEDEANFIAFLTTNYNKNIYFKYASYRMAFAYCISEVRKRDIKLYKKLWEKVNLGIAKDFSVSYDFWQSYKNPFRHIIKKGYNSYLKANNQEKGIETYNYVVNLLVNYFVEKGIVER